MTTPYSINRNDKIAWINLSDIHLSRALEFDMDLNEIL